MDVQSYFLHVGLFEDSFRERTPCFEKDGILVCQLDNSRGLKQGHRTWYENIEWIFLYLCLKHYEFNHNVYVFHVNGETLNAFLYINSLVITRTIISLILGLME